MVILFCQICGEKHFIDDGNVAPTNCKTCNGQLGIFPPKHIAEQSPVGLRYDSGKIRMDLLPPDGLLYLGKVYTLGADKYPPRNWEKGMEWSKCYGPLMRHTMAFWGGEENDKETGLLHTAHMTWNSMALLTYQIRGLTSFDDRLKVIK